VGTVQALFLLYEFLLRKVRVDAAIPWYCATDQKLVCAPVDRNILRSRKSHHKKAMTAPKHDLTTKSGKNPTVQFYCLWRRHGENRSHCIS